MILTVHQHILVIFTLKAYPETSKGENKGGRRVGKKDSGRTLYFFFSRRAVHSVMVQERMYHLWSQRQV